MAMLAPDPCAIGKSAQHSLDFGLIHQHQSADDRVEGPVRRNGNVARLEPDIRQAKVFHAAVRGVDVMRVAVDAV